MSEVRDNKRYAIPPIKQIDVTFFLSHVSSQLILTARQKQKTKKQKQKQTNKHAKKERENT